MSSTKHALSPLTTISRADSAVVIHAGSGADRQRVEFDSDDSGASVLVAWILARSVPATHDELIESLTTELGLPLADADDVVGQLVQANVFVDAAEADEWSSALRRWDNHGWDDAALFHYSTYGQPFDPDTLGDVSYEDYYASLLTDPTAGPQPPARKPPLAAPAEFGPPGDVAQPSVSFAEVLTRAAPINRFEHQGIDLDELHAVLADSFHAQRTVGGILGEHLIKPYPSGGARHPLEAYVIAKTVTDLPPSAYHVDAGDGTLRQLTNSAAVTGIDAVCFGKGGIVTASAVLVFTCRWPRHNWKYRYARSYRMVLLELGHAIQAVHLAARAHGLGAYHCPSINDAELLPLLDLTDDCAEGPLYAIGIGKDGIR